jgi:HSP20 family protein
MAKKPESKKVEVKKVKKAEAETKAVVPAVERMSHPLLSLRQEIGRLFEDFESRFPSLPFGFGRRSSEIEPFRRFGRTFEAELPNVDMTETAEAYSLTAEMPGLEEKDVDVTLTDDMLTVSGEKKEEWTEEEKDYHFSERRYGAFKRSFRLPASVAADKISASLKKGVLTVTLPKSEEAKKKVKKIDVRES